MNDFADINRMTLYEYGIRMKAYWLKSVDREYEIHLQAWTNWNVQAMKQQGKNKRVPVFRTFKQFFDYEKQLKMINGSTSKNKKNQAIAEILRRQREKEVR